LIRIKVLRLIRITMCVKGDSYFGGGANIMLRFAETDDDHSESVTMASAQTEAFASVPAPRERGGRYGEDRKFSTKSVVGVIAAHVAAFAAGMLLQPHLKKPEHRRLQMVEMKLDSPPPPAEQPKQKQAETVKLQVTPYTPPPSIPLVSTMTIPVEPAPQPVAVSPPMPPAPPAPPAAPSPPTTVQGGDIGTAMISAKPPRYPMDARRKREQGIVVLSVTLGVDGKVSSVTVQRSSGFASLDNAAREAVRQWRWAPTVRNGEPVLVRGVVEIPFVLQG
jgi:protein TonB